MVLVTCLLKTIDHNPFHPDLPQKIVVQEGLNLLQHTQVIGMEKENSAILGQNLSKNKMIESMKLSTL